MDLTPHIERLLADVAAAASLGDDETKRVVAALGRPTESAARIMLIGALSEFAREVEETTGTGVGIRIDGDRVDVDPRDRSDREEPREEAPPTFEDMTGDISRVTLRLVEQIKARAEEAAAQNGVSLNSWVAQAVQGALRDQSKYRERYRDYGDKWKSGRDYFQDLHPDDFRSGNWKKRPQSEEPGKPSDAAPSSEDASAPESAPESSTGPDTRPDAPDEGTEQQ
ncbi:toxin-antitoxin system HicB family antitoxin [Millisia brevis]|uniref:toxin-antitoxin system HicB family antitoxin n=1 Tax=Millisia brevis TaxID=264148 RepID=UPI0009FF9427|nr:toxin-antitoxin system HicB family antitoxin [Millisia brevis]